MDVVVWLRSLGLGKYEAIFRENDIDETVLPSLTHENLSLKTASACCTNAWTRLKGRDGTSGCGSPKSGAWYHTCWNPTPGPPAAVVTVEEQGQTAAICGTPAIALSREGLSP